MEHNPLVGPAPSEVPLKGAPLVRVIGQIRFPLLISVSDAEFVAPFQRAIQHRYPILRQEQITMFMMIPAGAPPTMRPAWRFTDVESRWRVSLTPEFAAIETTAYTSRDDFLKRWAEVLSALAEHVQPAQMDRLGLRYIDRITGEAIENISSLIRPEMRGISGTSLAAHARHILTEAAFSTGEATLLARWGSLPASTTTEPETIEPIDTPSWILDIDVSTTKQQNFSVERITELTKSFAERAYSMFRWAVTEDFLRKYGGDV